VRTFRRRDDVVAREHGGESLRITVSIGMCQARGGEGTRIPYRRNENDVVETSSTRQPRVAIKEKPLARRRRSARDGFT
jgi:hypothetical protein